MSLRCDFAFDDLRLAPGVTIDRGARRSGAKRPWFPRRPLPRALSFRAPYIRDDPERREPTELLGATFGKARFIRRFGNRDAASPERLQWLCDVARNAEHDLQGTARRRPRGWREPPLARPIGANSAALRRGVRENALLRAPGLARLGCVGFDDFDAKSAGQRSLDRPPCDRARQGRARGPQASARQPASWPSLRRPAPEARPAASRAPRPHGPCAAPTT